MALGYIEAAECSGLAGMYRSPGLGELFGLWDVVVSDYLGCAGILIRYKRGLLHREAHVWSPIRKGTICYRAENVSVLHTN